MNGNVLDKVAEMLDADEGLNEKDALRLMLVMQRETVTGLSAMEKRVTSIAAVQSEHDRWPSMPWLLWHQPRRFVWMSLVISLPMALLLISLFVTSLREPLLAALFGN